jgi:hypothetical protein
MMSFPALIGSDEGNPASVTTIKRFHNPANPSKNDINLGSQPCPTPLPAALDCRGNVRVFCRARRQWPATRLCLTRRSGKNWLALIYVKGALRPLR